jgi:phosphoribosyl-dephospho-CoA transferase
MAGSLVDPGWPASSPRPHDLLEVHPERLISGARKYSAVPEWVAQHLRTTPFVVVRCGPAANQNIPIGVRGATRNQRWAAHCQPEVVKRAISPTELRSRMATRSRGEAIPALRSLYFLENRWIDLDRPWGPGGSVGFELATGRSVATPESDLDIVIYAERPMTADKAKVLCAGAMDLPAAIDIRVETPQAGFSLREYAYASPAPILLRTPRGAMLGGDPWTRI